MNWDIVQGNWEQLKGKFRQQWGDFTDDEWDEIRGRREELVGKLREKYGWEREEAEERADEFARTLDEPVGTRRSVTED